METLANTKDNEARIKALKTIGNTVGKLFWVGNTIHDDLDKCLTVLNLNSTNSGWYKPAAVRINGLTGIYMVNEDGSLFCEARIIKQDAKKYLIEYLSNEGWTEFENLYHKFINKEQKIMKTYTIKEIINKFGYNPLPLVVKTKVKDKYRLVKPTDIWDSLFEDGTVRSFAADSKGNIYSPYNTDENLPFKIWAKVS